MQNLKNTTIFFISISLLLTSCAGVFKAHQTVFLRSKPAIVSRDDIILMIQDNGFNHPADLSLAGLSGRVSGNFQHEYEVLALNNEEVVIDHATDLMWQRSGSPFGLSWMQAKAYVDQLNEEQFAGYTDWRLPTTEELTSLLEFKKRHEEMYINPVFNTRQFICWSADILNSSANVWFVYFDHGYVSNTDADTELYVRAVRLR